jgi:hypothetical protein
MLHSRDRNRCLIRNLPKHRSCNYGWSINLLVDDISRIKSGCIDLLAKRQKLGSLLGLHWYIVSLKLSRNARDGYHGWYWDILGHRLSVLRHRRHHVNYRWLLLLKSSSRLRFRIVNFALSLIVDGFFFSICFEDFVGDIFYSYTNLLRLAWT